MNRDEFHRLLTTEFSTVDIYHRVIRNLDWKEIEKNANVQTLIQHARRKPAGPFSRGLGA